MSEAENMKLIGKTITYQGAPWRVVCQQGLDTEHMIIAKVSDQSKRLRIKTDLLNRALNGVALSKNAEVVSKMIDAITERLSYLYSRWQDEKEHEDIAEYGVAIKKVLPQGFEFVAMTKRPFGFKFTFDGELRHLTMTARNITWKILPH